MSLLQRILVVSKKKEMEQLAKKVSQKIFMADDVAEARDIVEAVHPELVMFDPLFGPDHIKAFVETTDNLDDIPVVVVHHGDAEIATQYRQVGALACLEDHEDVDCLKQIAIRITGKARSTDGMDIGTRFVDSFAATIPIVGCSQATLDELHLIKLVANSRCNPILIVGETGTGKEVAALAVHQWRHPCEQFVAVNCAALTANLLESELFGHVKGSFTGADREKTGLFELAGAGTIFLDEISEMPLDLQAKLLRVLQDKRFRKVGGIKDIQCRATIIASSNRHLKEEVQAKRFRQDLYYRLNVCPIAIRPLRSPRRREDILVLAEYFLHCSEICPDKKGKIKTLTTLAAQALQKHDWPGNVRELKNVMDRAILLENTDKIGFSSIIIDPENHEHHYDGDGIGSQIKDFSLAKAERELIARALRETGWQKTQAASLLGITRATLYAKVKQYHIEKDPSADPSSHDIAEASFAEPVLI